MLRQAAAMLIPFTAAIATYSCRGTLSISLKYSTLAGTAVLVFELAVRVIGSRGAFAGDRRLLARAVDTARKV
jgi:hypothetical protein